MYIVTWNREPSRKLKSVGAVDDLLDALHERFTKVGAPALVTVERGNGGDSLAIGLGRERTVLSFVRSDKDPPYFVSLGGERDGDSLWFDFGGDWSEFPFSQTVPLTSGRKAMREFCETGRLTKDLLWEQG